MPRVMDCTVGPKSHDPIYIVSFYIKRVKTSWTKSTGVSVRGAALLPTQQIVHCKAASEVRKLS